MIQQFGDMPAHLKRYEEKILAQSANETRIEALRRKCELHTSPQGHENWRAHLASCREQYQQRLDPVRRSYDNEQFEVLIGLVLSKSGVLIRQKSIQTRRVFFEIQNREERLNLVLYSGISMPDIEVNINEYNYDDKIVNIVT